MAIGQILIILVPRKTVVPTPLRMALGEISHKWTGSLIKLRTGVFSVCEPEHSSINLTVVDYIRVADVASGPRAPHFTGLYGSLHRESSQSLAYDVRLRTLPFIDLKADDLPSLRTALEEAIMISRHQATETTAGRVGKDTQRCEEPGDFRKVLSSGRPQTMSTATDMATIPSIPTILNRSKKLKV